MPNVDRSQLIAAFALQMSFIDQDQFRAAMCVWNCEKSRLLDEILLEHESLDRETHALLVAVVDKHLEKRDGTAEASLASLPAPTIDVHETLGENLPVSLPRMSAEADEDPFKTINCETGRSSSYAGRFRITGLPNKGGMGQVSAALDEELNREVALKEIRAEYADDLDCRVRFVQEAEITGGLEHPGVVPVYGLGSHPDGRPFYAMRFIHGHTLQHAIDRFHAGVEVGTRSTNSTDIDPSHSDSHRQNGEFESFEFRKLLGRFIDVCNAIEYAHSRGVIHRDLKPHNIMLGKYGETLVVDWGLAKVTGRGDTTRDKGETTLRPTSSASGSTPTQMGQAHGTPAFMPPEQAVGKLDQIGAASDVYSLGATLYCLLTGKTAFPAANARNILRQVQAGEFPRPREVSPQVPKALEAICLRAMALNPVDRYVSAGELGEDVERYLAAGPAAARVERLTNPPQHGWMGWAYRHPLVATCVLSLVPNGVLSVANVWYDGNVVLSEANVHAVNVFWGMLVFWKIFFYGCGTTFALWQVLPLFAAMQGQPTASALASARRQCLRLGELIFWVSVVAWTGAGLVFPAWIDFVLQLSGSVEKGPGAQQYVHFFAAHVLCGLVAGAIVMSSLSFVAVRLFYPRLLRSSGAVDVRADGLLERSKRIDRFNSLAAGVPFFALVYMNFVDTDYKLSIMAMMLLGLLLMYLLAVKAIPEVKADLEALALLPVAFRSETRV
ncbi:MAG TPA: serine/threonine-protein kinase [Pirellulaceae bacterium]|nr:serine/threonine-protein kinase [Pirellulaceae bacterium]